MRGGHAGRGHLLGWQQQGTAPQLQPAQYHEQQVMQRLGAHLQTRRVRPSFAVRARPGLRQHQSGLAAAMAAGMLERA